MGGSTTIGYLKVIVRIKDKSSAERGEDHLLSKTQEVQSLATLGAVKRTQCLMPFRTPGKVISQFKQFAHPIRVMALLLNIFARVKLAYQGRPEVGEPLFGSNVGMAGEKIRQLQQVTIGIKYDSITSVGHNTSIIDCLASIRIVDWPS
jgi:hypothetical protein